MKTFTLRVTCASTRGIVAAISGALMPPEPSSTRFAIIVATPGLPAGSAEEPPPNTR